MSDPACPEPHYCEVHNQHYWLEDGCAECYREDSQEPPEIFEGTRDALDRLSVEKGQSSE